MADPRILVKMCGDAAVLRSLLPERWQAAATGYLMACGGNMGRPRTLPPGYLVELERAGPVSAARICTAAGDVAASGYAAEADGVFIFDRIRTDERHRRRGLGTALMHVLAACRASRSSRFVLVATDAGRGLYQQLGWSVLSPYATARLSSDAPR